MLTAPLLCASISTHLYQIFSAQVLQFWRGGRRDMHVAGKRGGPLKLLPSG